MASDFSVEDCAKCSTAHDDGPTAAVTVRQGRIAGGYDVDFVHPPPKQLQIECPICLEILRQLQIVSCCGYSFCLPCIERIRRDSRPCPLCKNPDFTIMANQGLERALYDFQVHCSHRELGCTWQGELRALHPHLNVDPQSPENNLKGCPFTELECLRCGDRIKRHALEDHQNSRCRHRLYTCEYCNNCTGIFEEVSSKHWAECGHFPVPCPNSCTPPNGESKQLIKRSKVDHHVSDECPLALLPCTLQYVGCRAIIHRKDMADHMRNESHTHLSLLAAENLLLTKKLHEKDEHVHRLTETNSDLRVSMEQQQKKLQDLEKAVTSLKADYESSREELRFQVTKASNQARDLIAKTHCELKLLREQEEDIDELHQQLEDSHETQAKMISTLRQEVSQLRKDLAGCLKDQQMTRETLLKAQANRPATLTREFSQLQEAVTDHTVEIDLLKDRQMKQETSHKKSVADITQEISQLRTHLMCPTDKKMEIQYLKDKQMILNEKMKVINTRTEELALARKQHEVSQKELANKVTSLANDLLHLKTAHTRERSQWLQELQKSRANLEKVLADNVSKLQLELTGIFEKEREALRARESLRARQGRVVMEKQKKASKRLARSVSKLQQEVTILRRKRKAEQYRALAKNLSKLHQEFITTWEQERGVFREQEQLKTEEEKLKTMKEMSMMVSYAEHALRQEFATIWEQERKAMRELVKAEQDKASVARRTETLARGISELQQEVAELRCTWEQEKHALGVQQEEKFKDLTKPDECCKDKCLFAPIDFRIPDLYKCCATGAKHHSPSFYTHMGGYKMCIRVDPGGIGDGKGTHISLSVHLLAGEFDSCLRFPFQCYVTVLLLNHSTDEHHKRTIKYTCKECILDGGVDKGCGLARFFPRACLWSIDPTGKICSFVGCDNSLTFRVISVELKL